MKTLKKIKVFPFAIFQTVLMALVGVLCGVLYAFGGLVLDILVTVDWLSAVKMGTAGLSYGTVLAFGALIGMPVIFAIVGFLAGVIEAVLYNLFARWFGGLKIGIE